GDEADAAGRSPARVRVWTGGRAGHHTMIPNSDPRRLCRFVTKLGMAFIQRSRATEICLAKPFAIEPPKRLMAETRRPKRGGIPLLVHLERSGSDQLDDEAACDECSIPGKGEPTEFARFFIGDKFLAFAFDACAQSGPAVEHAFERIAAFQRAAFDRDGEEGGAFFRGREPLVEARAHRAVPVYLAFEGFARQGRGDGAACRCLHRDAGESELVRLCRRHRRRIVCEHGVEALHAGRCNCDVGSGNGAVKGDHRPGASVTTGADVSPRRYLGSVLEPCLPRLCFGGGHGAVREDAARYEEEDEGSPQLLKSHGRTNISRDGLEGRRSSKGFLIPSPRATPARMSGAPRTP